MKDQPPCNYYCFFHSSSLHNDLAHVRDFLYKHIYLAIHQNCNEVLISFPSVRTNQIVQHQYCISSYLAQQLGLARFLAGWFFGFWFLFFFVLNQKSPSCIYKCLRNAESLYCFLVGSDLHLFVAVFVFMSGFSTTGKLC